MGIKANGTGSLSFQDDIEAEFGENPSRSLGSYRNTHPDFQNKNCGALTDLPLDTGIPKSGEIKFSDFYSKQLNIVVDYYTTAENRQTSGAATMAATSRYVNNNAKVKIVGGYQTKPTAILNQGTYNINNPTTDVDWRGAKKVFIHVNTTIGGEKAINQAGRNLVALRTGGWPSGTTLQIDIGSSGRLQGAGGDGRKGTTNQNQPVQALPGSSALGVEVPATIVNNGIIRCGYGGGGGGAGSNSDPNKSKTDYGRSGGGGGGGAGIPAGVGGAENCGGYTGKNPAGVCGGAGGNGDANNGGGGGGGADHGAGSGGGGNGGEGGDIFLPNAQNGDPGNPNAGAGGVAGPLGYGIIFNSAGVQAASSGNKTIPTDQGGVIVGGVF